MGYYNCLIKESHSIKCNYQMTADSVDRFGHQLCVQMSSVAPFKSPPKFEILLLFLTENLLKFGRR